LNKNNALSWAFALNIETKLTSQDTALSLCPNIIYKRLTPVAVHRINPLITVSNPNPFSTLFLINTIYKNKAITNVL